MPTKYIETVNTAVMTLSQGVPTVVGKLGKNTHFYENFLKTVDLELNFVYLFMVFPIQALELK